jgi:hypothetical protein
MMAGLNRILRNWPKHLFEQNIRPVFLILEGSLNTLPPQYLQRYSFLAVKNTFEKTEFHSLIRVAEDDCRVFRIRFGGWWGLNLIRHHLPQNGRGFAEVTAVVSASIRFYSVSSLLPATGRSSAGQL